MARMEQAGSEASELTVPGGLLTGSTKIVPVMLTRFSGAVLIDTYTE